jgi:purine-nucleoside phosphorylase
MHDLKTNIKETAQYLRQKGIEQPTIGIILGTGLGSLVHKIENASTVPYSAIPHFPESTVEFHKGNLIGGVIDKKTVLVMQGRFHYYEGYSMQQITFPVRVMKELGVKNLLLSNAAGGINNNLKKGDLVLLDDHINLLPENPLRGLNDPAFGNRFVDLSAPYDNSLNQIFRGAADKLSINLKNGIYAAVAGPCLETRAEYRYLKSIGADLVGMSTVPEVIVANHVGMNCAALSVVTDECDPDNLKPADINEITKVAGEADIILSNLFENVVKLI